MAEPQLEGTALTALTRSTLSQRSFRHRHLQSVTTEDEYTHIESHRAAVPWLHEECTSLHGQEKTPHGPQTQQHLSSHALSHREL